ncbi:MAG: 6-chlorohydroxyquinol-1,2-dioxygenase [Deltaproteobacteria bacterium]|nr:MAG: 6-chlorohydroxyquinol-1,2-dioxygenase [Deltaproteobacteria bacterium]
MRNVTEENLTDLVLARMNAENPRVQQIATALVKHLHAFVREVEPTEEEWMQGIQFLTRTGHTCNDVRQEFILLSDTLGVSMLVDAINNRKGDSEATESTVMGPFHTACANRENGDMIATGPEADEGDPLVVRGRVLSEDGTPLANAKMDVWQASHDGFYDVQPESRQPTGSLRGVFQTDENGEFWFRSIVPLYYPIPTDGPVGEMLKATGRNPMRPSHIHFWVAAEGHESLVTHLFREGDPYLDSDTVFGVKESLIVDFVRNDSPDAAVSYGFNRPFYEVERDFILKKA